MYVVVLCCDDCVEVIACICCCVKGMASKECADPEERVIA